MHSIVIFFHKHHLTMHSIKVFFATYCLLRTFKRRVQSVAQIGNITNVSPRTCYVQLYISKAGLKWKYGN